jgi:hypothetical protein
VNCNLRIFRRNAKNLIFLWNAGSLPDAAKDVVSAFLVDEDGNEGPLKFSKFVPDNPSKFQGDVDGIVIAHDQNKMDAESAYTVRIIIGDGDEPLEFIKEVLPANAVPPPERTPQDAPKVVHVYGMDYKTKRWVPFPVDPSLFGGDE